MREKWKRELVVVERLLLDSTTRARPLSKASRPAAPRQILHLLRLLCEVVSGEDLATSEVLFLALKCGRIAPPHRRSLGLRSHFSARLLGFRLLVPCCTASEHGTLRAHLFPLADLRRLHGLARGVVDGDVFQCHDLRWRRRDRAGCPLL